MTQDEIIRMAVKCQLLTTSNRDGLYAQALEAFAKLVAQQEREACAKVCEETDDGTPYNLAEECAAAIRTRGQA
jgi:hypothetical protein